MADGGFQMVAAAYPSPPNQQAPHHQYSFHPPASDPRRRQSITNLPLHLSNVRGNVGALSMSPPDIKPESSGAGAGIAYGGPPQAVMQNPDNSSNNNNNMLGELVFAKPSVEKKLTRDGQPAKRRGPKPDSKPAMTRRQELNRQAQRYFRAFLLGQTHSVSSMRLMLTVV